MFIKSVRCAKLDPTSEFFKLAGYVYHPGGGPVGTEEHGDVVQEEEEYDDEDIEMLEEYD